MSFGIPTRNGLAIGLLASTYLSSRRAAYPAMSLDFLQPFLDSRITFSRGTNATLVDSTGKIVYAPANLLTYSQEIGGTNWLSDDVTVALNSIAAPNGTLTASTITDTVTNSDHRIISGGTNPSFTASVSYTLSVYVKNNTRNFVQLAFGTAAFGATAYANFDVTTGVVGTVGSGTTASITAVGSGWYRCAITAPATATASTSIFFALITSATAVRAELYAGTGSSLYVWGAQLEPVTYQTTPSTYNVTTSAAYYGPRFDYDPVTLAAKGLLIEEARTNLLLYSEDLTNAVWVKSGSTATANTATSPAGTTTADRWEPTLTGTIGTTRLLEAAVVTIGAVYTSSAYVKAAGKRWVFFTSPDAANAAHYCWFDLQTGTVGTKGASVTTATITPAGDGWFRLTTSSTSTSATNYVFISATDADNSTTVTANGNAILIWGAQLEAGAFATSYIPTVASTVTRSADIATMTGTNFSSWYNQSEGTFVSDWDSIGYTANTMILAATDSGSTNLVQQFLTSSTSPRFIVRTSGVDQAALDSTSGATTVNKMASAYKVNDFASTVNGATVVTDVAGTIPTVDRLGIGSRLASLIWNGHIRQIAYYNTRLPNAQLQALTAPSMVTTLSLDFINGVYDA